MPENGSIMLMSTYIVFAIVVYALWISWFARETVINKAIDETSYNFAIFCIVISGVLYFAAAGLTGTKYRRWSAFLFYITLYLQTITIALTRARNGSGQRTSLAVGVVASAMIFTLIPTIIESAQIYGSICK